MSIQDNEFVNKKKKNRLYGYAKPLYKAYCNIIGQRYVLPDFLILGVAKGGTTSIYEYLSQHPGFIPASGKEVYFFDKNFHMGTNWYRKFFPSKKIMSKKSKELGYDALTGEATPRYIHYPHAPKRVFEIIPSTKFIVLLRNPIDRAYSHHQMHYSGGTETNSFEDAISIEGSIVSTEMEKMEKDENFYSIKFYKRSYVTRGKYAEQLERWFKYFPREQFLILQSEKFSTDIQNEFEKVLKFLGLPDFKLDITKKYKSRKYEKMTPETRKKLVEFFKPHNERLYKLLGTNFHWDE